MDGKDETIQFTDGTEAPLDRGIIQGSFPSKEEQEEQVNREYHEDCERQWVVNQEAASSDKWGVSEAANLKVLQDAQRLDLWLRDISQMSAFLPTLETKEGKELRERCFDDLATRINGYADEASSLGIIKRRNPCHQRIEHSGHEQMKAAIDEVIANRGRFEWKEYHSDRIENEFDLAESGHGNK